MVEFAYLLKYKKKTELEFLSIYSKKNNIKIKADIFEA